MAATSITGTSLWFEPNTSTIYNTQQPTRLGNNERLYNTRNGNWVLQEWTVDIRVSTYKMMDELSAYYWLMEQDYGHQGKRTEMTEV